MGDEEEWARLPLSEQFTHKNWKARKLGYEAATKGFATAQPRDAIVRDFIMDSNLWKGAVGDANVAAQQEALGAYNAFLDIAGTEGARKTRSSTIAPIVEKGLTGRPAAKQAALESLLLLIELDKADPVIEEMLPFASHKQPKLVAIVLSALTSIVHAYGCKIVEPKAVIKILPKSFGHADKNVRAEAQNLTVELYRWLREAMKPLFWGELKPVQQTDLEKLFGPVQSEPPAKQERLLRSQQVAREEAAAAPDSVEAYDGEDAEIDLEPEFMAIDVAAKLPTDLGDRLSSSKWKDRKEVLDEVFAAVNVPAILEGPFDEVVRGCAKGMKDANIMVVVVSANVIEALAKGLRKAFSKYRSTILAAMLERFKEKKASVTDAIGAACDAVFLATNLGDIQADSLEALKNKNPQVKENTAKFLIRSLKTTKEAPSLEQTKDYAQAAKALLSESAAPLRDAGAEILGVMWKIMGDRNMLSHVEGVDEIRKTKIKEFCDAAEVRTKWKPKTAAPPPKAAAAPASSRRPPPSAKKPALTATRPAPAPTPASPTPIDDDVTPAPRSVARPVSKPPGSLRPPGTGLKAPSGLQKPTAGLKAPANSLMSPKRQGVVFEEEVPLAALRTPVAANRGLAGRPLSKPTAPTTPPPAFREPPPTPSFSSVERQELLDLREEVDLVRQQASDLRQEKMRLTSQIHELQNQNAQLIEDHTRDVLQIKAKETQLVRARSNAENAEERGNSLSKEIDRLKREMSRLGRQNAGRDSPVDYGNQMGNGSYRYSSHRPYNVQSGYGADSFNTIAEDGEANNHTSRPMSMSPSGRATPASIDTNVNGVTRSSSTTSKSPNEGVESWRRAAEVTQNLKARIEMMKARQNIGRGQ